MLEFVALPQWEQRWRTALLLVVVFIVLCVVEPIYSSTFVASLVVLALVFEWVPLALRTPWLWVMTPFYPLAPSFVLVLFNGDILYRRLLVPAVILCAACDAGSYIVGSMWGRRLIAPALSAGKTWEGFGGGLLGALGALVLFSYFVRGVRPSWGAWVATVGTCVIALAGDLFESFIKRRAGVKNSGVLLPGHGGVLDRCDSLLFVGPFFYLVRNHVVNFFF